MYIRLVFKLGSLVLLSALALSLLSACSKQQQVKKSEPVLSTTAQENIQSVSDDNNFSEEKEYEIDTHIMLNDENTTIKGKGARFENNVLTVTEGGTYSLSGQLTDGKIYVNSSDEDKKVKLYLDGVTVSCRDDAPLFVENSPRETILILAENSQNTFTDSADRQVPSDGSDYATATIYSKDDLQIEGTGELNVNANFNKGIFSKNDIDIRGGNINITSVDDGIRGKESVEISDGKINIKCGGDGIRTSEEKEADKGDISISGGNIIIESELDGIQAVKSLAVTGGTINITSGGGAVEVKVENQKFPGMPGEGMNPGRGKGKGPGNPFGGMRPPESSTQEQQQEDSPSVKGIKAAGEMKISGCTLTVSSADDAIHANVVEISSGTLSLESSDDAIHADSNVKISGGDISAPMCYEGIEGQVIDISEGRMSLTCSDDGINAVSPDSNESAGGPPMMQADNSCQINISGGYVHINAEGDGVDSNGNVNMTDGTVIVFGPQNGGNGALDYGGQFTVEGGTLLALGSAGMAQSVTGKDGVRVFAYNYSQQADVLSAVTNQKNELVIGFKSPKAYQTVVFACEDTGDTYSLYEGGSIDGEEYKGIYFDGQYKAGTLVGVLS